MTGVGGGGLDEKREKTYPRTTTAQRNPSPTTATWNFFRGLNTKMMMMRFGTKNLDREQELHRGNYMEKKEGVARGRNRIADKNGIAISQQQQRLVKISSDLCN